MSLYIPACSSEALPKFFKVCSITGRAFDNLNDYQKSEWSAYPNGRIRTIKLLSASFGITLGQPNTETLLQQAKDRLQHAYDHDAMSTLEIHKKFNLKCSVGHVSNLLKSLNIKRRSLSDAAALAIVMGRAPTVGQGYKSGTHIDWEGKHHFFRSSYELKYYQLLDDVQIPYLTEALRVSYYDSSLQKERIAIPDILIGQTIVEIKSSWTYNKINMADKLNAYKFLGYQTILNLDFKDYIIHTEGDLP